MDIRKSQLLIDGKNDQQKMITQIKSWIIFLGSSNNIITCFRHRLHIDNT